MFSRKRIAVVSGILSGLVVTCAGATQAYAEAASVNCGRNTRGIITCTQSGYTSDNTPYVVRQTQDCLPLRPVKLPTDGVVNTSTLIGPSVSCSNSSAPSGGGAEPPGPGF
ncbi:hypothetical protein [Streptomyces halobius]|uniref:Secreted protein n=1 Tax=Streptomyces halobius TaxID=2879846 RepID=A0ABY4MB66_9ACTN|nr:hypothetical protein [Streptomyces halobius]UQA95034.1 hypothetical protein K9S39_27095 [Streptomyces halobius]